MLFNYLPLLCTSMLGITLFTIAFLSYIYWVTTKSADPRSPQKQVKFSSFLLALFLFPFMIGLSILLFVLRAVFYAVFLFVFMFALIFVRKPFIFAWLEKVAREIGEPLLGTNPYPGKDTLPSWT